MSAVSLSGWSLSSKETKPYSQVTFWISPVFCHMAGLILEEEILPTQGTEIRLLEGGEKWCRISRGNIRPHLEGGDWKKSFPWKNCWRYLGTRLIIRNEIKMLQRLTRVFYIHSQWTNIKITALNVALYA